MSQVAQSDVAVAAKLFRGLADTTRLGIVLALCDGEHSVSELVEQLGSSQSNISGHLSCLKECGLITDRPEGRRVHYRIADPGLQALLGSAEQLLGNLGHEIEICPNYCEAAP